MVFLAPVSPIAYPCIIKLALMYLDLHKKRFIICGAFSGFVTGQVISHDGENIRGTFG